MIHLIEKMHKNYSRPVARVLAPYAKLYLVKGKKCLEKQKTKSNQPTLEPVYQTKFVFRTNPDGCVLQVRVLIQFTEREILIKMIFPICISHRSFQITLWGDYGKLDARKVFMGISQIQLSDLDLNRTIVGWYKLFKTCMLVSMTTEFFCIFSYLCRYRTF